MDISKRIKYIRESKGLSQKEIADKMGLEQPNYGRFERRGKKLTIEQLEQIADALGVTLKEILYGEAAAEGDLAQQRSQILIERQAKEIEHLKQVIEDKQKENEFLKDQSSKLIDILGKESTKDELETYKKGLAALVKAVQAKGLTIEELVGPETTIFKQA